MNTPEAKQLAQDAITNLLQRIQDGVHKEYSPTDLIEGMQLEYMDIVEHLLDHNEHEYLTTIPEEDEDAFKQLVNLILNDDWYEELYQEHVDRARQGAIDQQDLQQTNKSLMPTWRP